MYCKSKTQAAVSYIYTQGLKILYKNKDIRKYGFDMKYDLTYNNSWKKGLGLVIVIYFMSLTQH